jgi:hypothetical protein
MNENQISKMFKDMGLETEKDRADLHFDFESSKKAINVGDQMEFIRGRIGTEPKQIKEE